MDSVNGFIQKTYQKDIDEVILIQTHCSEICNSFTKFHRKNIPSIETKLAFQKDDNMPGVPGTFQDVTEAVFQCFTEYLKILDEELKNLWTSLSSQFIQFDEDNFKSHQSKLATAVNKYNQLISETNRMTTSKAQIILRFNKYTTKIADSNSKEELSQFRMQYDEIAKNRASLAKRRNSILKESQELLGTIRQESSIISDILTEYNTNVKDYYQMFYGFFTDTDAKLKILAETFNQCIDVMDSTTDFKNFIEKNKIVRSDLVFEFEKFDTSSPAFAGCKPCPKIEIPVDFPIAMANVLKSYNADGENEISCKKGKNIFLAEIPENEWCYVIKPFTWSTGFVPSACLQRIGAKLGAIKNDNLPKAFGEAGDFVAIISEDEYNYFIENIFGQQISVPKENISLVFA